ncbi:MAG TPA: PIG-L family deacetylase [Acidobacteriota bacterium]|nr:PIG-L family deacetylase [Acidobacteriota bacterium]
MSPKLVLIGIVAAAALVAGTFTGSGGAQPVSDGKPRIICIGAHPDDAESGAAGTAALWIAKGYHVKFVAVTNGDIGHWIESGPSLARRRKAEVEHGAKVVGYDFEILDNHDGELQPTIENRKTITRLIREWKADVVITHRPNDYHPDHRYTSILVQDSAYMVTVPMFCPEVPALKTNPVFLYFSDRFQKPYPFQPDVAVDIDSVMEKKLDVLLGMVSQFYEGGVSGSPELLTSDPEKQKARWQAVRQRFIDRQLDVTSRFRKGLENWYGRDRAAGIKYAEAFEICEYGRQPDKTDLKRLFPFF